METDLKERLFPFDGEDVDYILYLESRLRVAESFSPMRRIGSSSPLLTGTTPSSDIHDGLIDGWTFVYCNFSRSSVGTRTRDNHTPSPLPRSPISCKRRKKTARLPQWHSEMNSFIHSIQSTSTWATRRISCGFSSAESNRLALCMMLGRPSSMVYAQNSDSTRSSSPISPGSSDIVTRCCRYGQLASHYTSTTRFAILVTKYQKIIFICYCTVLLELGTLKETVNWMLKQYISDSNDKNLERYRLGALWVNRCVSRLLRLGWGHRSWEVFVLYAQAPHRYGRFSDNSDSINVFTTMIGSADVPIYEDGWIPYCIPCIIKCLAGNSIKLSQICACLGYDFDLISRIYCNFFEDL